MSETIQILVFGKLTDILPALVFKVDAGETVASLKHRLEAEYPALSGRTYRISVNRKMVDEKSFVMPGDEIALMPPFSGG
jgi:molybdopterin synthase sulfur carrier subunit